MRSRLLACLLKHCDGAGDVAGLKFTPVVRVLLGGVYALTVVTHPPLDLRRRVGGNVFSKVAVRGVLSRMGQSSFVRRRHLIAMADELCQQQQPRGQWLFDALDLLIGLR